jgi:hypothetical protein
MTNPSGERAKPGFHQPNMDPNIEQLTDERDTYEAQRDHYRDHCSDLQTQLTACQKQLESKFQTAQFNIDPSIFKGESLARLREWKECLDFAIGEVEEQQNGKVVDGERESKGDGDGNEGTEEEGKKVEGRRKRKAFETELPFSPSNLTWFLTRNHQLTQGRTQYPEARPKNV